MKEIIAPVDRELLLKELNQERFIRNTNKGGNQIFIVTAKDSPNVMKEIGRLREWSFRLGGGGCGEEIDVDEFDYMDVPYKQLIVWDPEAKEITGGYRYLHGKNWKMLANGQPRIVTEHMFRFSDEFIRDYMPYAVDLGRAFIHPDYQSSKMGAKSIFAFDNLWDGLLVLNFFEPEIRYVIGKITVYQNFNVKARTAIFYFLNHCCADPKGLMVGKDVFFDKNTEVEPEIKETFDAEDTLEGKFTALQKYVRGCGVNIPPLISSYFKLSNQMKVFGTGVNREFGDILDTGMMVTVSEIDKGRWSRHVDSYLKDKQFREENNIMEDAAHPLLMK